ncbi:radical SAM protein [Desulfovibrio sp. JC010]|uniref:radical SAM protein n=1 Tax=Desulfovibrio sp. JC010 TaxID=2593641 RepID=UPI0013D6A46C|nr:radical SAM protein [Desulfovibrio sp. JC010]
MAISSLHSLPPGTPVRAGDINRYDAETPFVVNWVVSNACNFSCSYCSEASVTKYNVPRMEDLKKSVNAIAALDRTKVKFTLTGGEPTIHPDFVELVQYILETLGDRVFIHIMTNLSQSPQFFSDFAEKFKNYTSQIDFDASIHLEQVDMSGFEQAATILSDAGFVVVAYVLAHPRYMKIVRKTHEHICGFELENFRARPPKVVIFSGNRPSPPVFTQEDSLWLGIGQGSAKTVQNLFVDRIKTTTPELVLHRELFDRNTLIASQQNNFKGLLCNAGVDSIAIDQNGLVDRAVCFRGSGLSQLNIYTDPNILDHLGSPVKCPFEQCFCGADLVLPKYIIPELGPNKNTA